MLTTGHYYRITNKSLYPFSVLEDAVHITIRRRFNQC